MEITATTQSSMQKVLYTAKTSTIGGRDGSSKSSDARLDIQLTPPGAKGGGTNPEQLFAAGWSACFLGAVGLAAKKLNVILQETPSIDAEVDLGTNDDGFLLQARLNIHLPGIEKEIAEELVHLAHQTCPYSKATRGNINVELNII